VNPLPLFLDTSSCAAGIVAGWPCLSSEATLAAIIGGWLAIIAALAGIGLFARLAFRAHEEDLRRRERLERIRRQR